MTEDEMVGQYLQSNQHDFDPTPGGSGRQEGLACCGSMGSQRVGHNLTTKQQQQRRVDYYKKKQIALNLEYKVDWLCVGYTQQPLDIGGIRRFVY